MPWNPPPTRQNLAATGVAVTLLGIVAGLLWGFHAGSDDSRAVAAPRRAGSAQLGWASLVGTPCAAGHPASITAGAHSFVYGQERRAYRLTLPAKDKSGTAHPIVFDFHGFKASKELEEQRSRLGELASARGFVVVTPDALGSPRRWNTPGDPAKADDVGFVTALLDDLEGRLCLDDHRVYAAGHSNGAEFAAALVCRSPRFAAVAMVSSTSEARCPDGVTPATMAVHGTADPSVPYAGGMVVGGTAPVPAAQTVIRDYAGRYGCDPAPVTGSPHSGVTSQRFAGCTGNAEVVLDTVAGGTHFWPSSPEALRDPADSAAGKTFDATGAILDFFTAHRLPTSR